MRSAAKFHLSTEAAALLVVQAAYKVIGELVPQVAKLSAAEREKTVRITFRKETLFLKSQSSSLSAELHMRRQAIHSGVRSRLPHIPCKFVVVHGTQK